MLRWRVDGGHKQAGVAELVLGYPLRHEARHAFVTLITRITLITLITRIIIPVKQRQSKVRLIRRQTTDFLLAEQRPDDGILERHIPHHLPVVEAEIGLDTESEIKVLGAELLVSVHEVGQVPAVDSGGVQREGVEVGHGMASWRFLDWIHLNPPYIEEN